MTWKEIVTAEHPEITVMIRDLRALKGCCTYWKDRINSAMNEHDLNFAKKLYKARNEERRMLKAKISDLVCGARFEEAHPNL